MDSLINRAADVLFPEAGRRTLNVKFFRGGDDNVSAQHLAEQVIRAETQIQTGRARLMERIDS